MNPSPTTEERIWSVLSHLSALAFGIGILFPILGWSEQRHKSKYASFQSLQALGYQSLGYTIWLLVYIVLVILFTIATLPIAINDQNGGTAMTIASIIFMLMIFGLLGIYLLLPVIAAIACGLGKDFRYPILGTRLAKYLGFQLADDEPAAMIEEHEERWVASMGHFSVIIALWGLLAPATTWILQGRHSAFLKFQSIQTTIYQGVVNLLFLGAGGVYFLGILMTVFTMLLAGGASMGKSVSMAGLLLLFATMLLSALIVLAIPLFHILGQWAGFRVLKGDNYHYPIIGRMVEKRLSKSYGVQELAPESNSIPYGHDELFDSTRENS